MKNEQWILIAVAAVVVYFLFLRKRTAVVAVTSTAIPTGAAATGYTGGGLPIAAGTYVAPTSSANSTGSTLAGIGGLLGGVGTAAGSILGALGNAGVLSGSSSDSGGYDSYGDDGSDF